MLIFVLVAADSMDIAALTQQYADPTTINTFSPVRGDSAPMPCLVPHPEHSTAIAYPVAHSRRFRPTPNIVTP